MNSIKFFFHIVKFPNHTMVLLTLAAFTHLAFLEIANANPIGEACYQFDISNYSPDINLLNLNLKTDSNVKIRASLSVTKGTVTHSADFDCSREEAPSRRLLCTSIHGDFYLSNRSDSFMMSFVYINLAPHAPGVELTDEFAIFDNRNKNYSGHTKVSKIISSQIDCPL